MCALLLSAAAVAAFVEATAQCQRGDPPAGRLPPRMLSFFSEAQRLAQRLPVRQARPLPRVYLSPGAAALPQPPLSSRARASAS